MLPYCPTTRNPFIGDNPPQEEYSNSPGIGSRQHNLRPSNHHKAFGNGPATYYAQYYSANSHSQYTQHHATTGERSPFYQQPITANELNPQQPHLYFPNGPNATYPPRHLVYTPEFFSYFDPHGLQPKDYANFPLFELSRHELRSQLNSIGREIGLQTAGSTTTASKYATYLGNPEFLMLYLVVLGQFLAQGGQVYFVKLPPPSPGNSIFTFPTTPSFSSTLPIRQNTSKRGRDSRKGFRSSCRKLNTVDTNDYVPDFTPLTSIDVTPNNDSSPGFSRQQVPSKKHVTIEFGDAVSVCLNLDKPPGGRREPVETAGYPFPVLDGESLQKLIAHEKSQKSAISSTISSTASNVSSMFSPSVETTPNRPLHALVPTRPLAPEPLLLPHSTCFIRCDPDQGIRICILPEIMENSEITWIDLPGIWIHTTKQKLPEGAFVMGFADWIYSEQWISALYQEVLINESLRGCEQDYAKSGHVWEASGIVSGYKDAYMESTSDLEGNTKSVRRTIQYPSGDDLGVNWSASEAENTRTKLANKREISVKWEREVRESTWPWYLWRQFGLSRGWIKEPEEFGDRMRNKDDVEGLRRIITHGCSPVGYEDMDEALDGESIADFRTWWRIRHKCFGGPKWEGL